MFNSETIQVLPKTAICQQLLLDSEGYIVESDDNIFASFGFKEKSVREWLPFVESIFPLLENLTLSDSELRFERVFPDSFPLKGIYDFAFLKVALDSKLIIVWSLYDVTSSSIKKGIEQQRLNEQLLKEEYAGVVSKR